MAGLCGTYNTTPADNLLDKGWGGKALIRNTRGKPIESR